MNLKKKKIKIKGKRAIYNHSVISFKLKKSKKVRRGTVVYIYNNLKAMEVELDDVIVTVKSSEVVCV